MEVKNGVQEFLSGPNLNHILETTVAETFGTYCHHHMPAS